MKKIFILGFLCLSVTVQAQLVKGKVYMEKDKNPAQFASVGLIQLPDSNIISGVITLTDGSYSFEAVKSGNYIIKVSHLGYGLAEKEYYSRGSDDYCR